MNHLLSQIKYFKTKKKSFPDPLSNWTQISLSEPNEKVKIIFRQKEQSHWKYCLAPIIFNSVLYTFLKIHAAAPKSSFKSPIFLIQVHICLHNLKQTETILFQSLSNQRLKRAISSLLSFSLETFTCNIINPQMNQKRLVFKFKTQKPSKQTCDKIIKTSFFCFFILINRLKSYHKINQQTLLTFTSNIYELRYSISAFKKAVSKNLPIQSFTQFKKEEKKIDKNCAIITLKPQGLLDRRPQFFFSFSENVEKRNNLQKLYQEEKEKRKKIFKKERIFSNIEIEKEQNFKGFCIQTKFSIITQCSLVFKIIQTHMNRRNDYLKSKENIDYFNYLVNITKIQSTLCIRKKPLLSTWIQKSDQKTLEQTTKDQIEMKEKAKRILKTEKNCLDIMKDSLVANICAYYVHYKEENTLYSKMYKLTLEDWKQTKSSKKDQTLLDIFLQILNGLHQMAQHNIIHRDLKPDNILIDDSDPLRPIVKLIDFGSTIYIHSESENYQQEVMEIFDTKLRTTKPYNMDFNEFRKLCCAYSPHNLYKYTESSYNRHANFDLHSVGKIIEDFLPKFKNSLLVDNLKFLIVICTCPDPEYRLSLEETALFIATIKNFFFSL